MEPAGLVTINDRVEQVRERIEKTAQSCGRNSADIELVAVTKKKSAAVVKELSESGINKIGESYLKEALFKIDILQDYQLEWHMIGTIQHGKEKQIAQHFAEVHSVDRITVAEELNRRAEQAQRVLPVYLEYNVSGEDTKHGWQGRDSHLWEKLLPEFEKVIKLSSLKIKGLMTMAPYDIDPEEARPYFIRLRKLRNYLVKKYPRVKLEGLSMGMSGDFETAIEEGATVLRIGSALVGPR